MDKKYTVSEFVDEYKKRNNTLEKNMFLDSNLEVEDYISYKLKMTFAKNMIESTVYAVEPIINENGEFEKNEDGKIKFQKTNRIKIDTNTRYILFVCTLIQQYTNIDINFNRMVDEFDMLNKEGLIDEIIKIIPENEVNEFNRILKATFDDFVFNNTEPHIFVSNQIQRFVDILKITMQPIMEQVMENLDEETLENIGKNIDKFLGNIK